MKNPHLTLTLLLTALFVSSCRDSADEQPAPAVQTPPSAGSTEETAYNPFTGEPFPAQYRITQLPSDEFFVQHNYPGSEVYDVRSVFGTPSVFLHTNDDFEKVDAFYKKKFTNSKGEVQGRLGFYYRELPDKRLQSARFDRRPGGGCIIELSM
jgi:hypothetical protein